MNGSRARRMGAVIDQANQQDDTLPIQLSVWWHTLSHRLLRALSIDSGYSSAAIRERVYLRMEPGGAARGGLLLYTVQPGGDGTLGGLIGLVPTLDRVLASALRDLRVALMIHCAKKRCRTA